MPVIMCSYCGYVGSKSGPYRDYDGEIQDVEEHEKNCNQRIALEKAGNL